MLTEVEEIQGAMVACSGPLLPVYYFRLDRYKSCNRVRFQLIKEIASAILALR
jgi:hypothetical protein